MKVYPVCVQSPDALVKKARRLDVSAILHIHEDY